MKIQFRLTNTANRAMRLNCLDKALLIEPSGSRGSEAVVQLDEWRFRFRGDAQKTLAPFIKAGLRIAVETDQSLAPAEPVQIKESGRKIGAPAPMNNDPSEVRAIHSGTPKVELFGQLDLSEDSVLRTIGPQGDGARAFASAVDYVNFEDPEQAQRVRRLPHSDGEPLAAPPAKGPLPNSTPDVIAEASLKADADSEALRKAAEADGEKEAAASKRAAEMASKAKADMRAKIDAIKAEAAAEVETAKAKADEAKAEAEVAKAEADKAREAADKVKKAAEKAKATPKKRGRPAKAKSASKEEAKTADKVTV